MTDVTVIGNVGGDPELRFSPNGDPVLNFNLAENHSKRDPNGNGYVDDGTTWRRCSLWGWRAEVVGEHLKRGDRLIVTGRERLREFESKDGSQGRSLELTVRELGRAPKKPNSGQGGAQGGYQSQGGNQGNAQGGFGQSRQGGQSQGGWGQNPNSDPWADSNVQGGGQFPDEPPF